MKMKIIVLLSVVCSILTLSMHVAAVTPKTSEMIMSWDGVDYGKITVSGELSESSVDFNIEDELFHWSCSRVSKNSVCTIEAFDFEGYMSINLESYVLADGVYRFDQRDDWMHTELLADGKAMVGMGSLVYSNDISSADYQNRKYFVTQGHPASFVFGENKGMMPIYESPYSFELKADGTLYVLRVDIYNEFNEFVCRCSQPFFVEEDNEIIKIVPTNSTVSVDGKIVSFDAYNINGNNYFKLRDLAKAVCGSEKQFEVTWDNSMRTVNLTSNSPYTSVGGELQKGDGIVKKFQKTNSPIYLDGKLISLTAYNINGNNYFKLRDIGLLFDFDVSWDSANNSVIVETDKGYTED